MKKRYKFLVSLLVILIIGLLIPQDLQQPVENATASDYHPNSFWYHPWGTSGTHKGVDVFAKKGTNINSATKGFVVYSGTVKNGGNVLLILGPKWRLHYYAHLETKNVSTFDYVNHNTKIGTVGDTGNAKGKPAHLHYSIASMLSLPWRIDTQPQGWKKMFYLNPISYFPE